MSFSRQSRRTCQRRWHWLKKWNQTTRGTHSHRRLQGAKKMAHVGAGKNTHLTKQHKAQVHPAPCSTWGHARTHEGRQRDGNDKNLTQQLRFGRETVPIEDGGPDVIGRLLYPPYLWCLIRLHLQNNRCATSSKVPSKGHKLIHLKFHLIRQIR